MSLGLAGGADVYGLLNADLPSLESTDLLNPNVFNKVVAAAPAGALAAVIRVPLSDLFPSFTSQRDVYLFVNLTSVALRQSRAWE